MIDSGKKKLISNILWLAYNKVFMMLISLFVTVRIVNHYGSAEYGEYAYAVNVVALLEIINTLVEVRVVKKRYTDHPKEFVVWNATVSRIITSVAALVIGIVFMLIYRGSAMLNMMLLVLMLNSIIGSLRFGMETHFEYCLNSKRMVISTNIASLLTAGLQLAAIYFNWSILSLCLISTAGAVVMLIMIAAQYKAIYHCGIKNQTDFSFIKTLVIESIPLTIAAASATIYTKSDSVMIEMLMGDYAPVGIYAVALKLYSVVQIAIVPVRTSFFPKQMELYRSDRVRYKKLYVRVSSAMTWLCIAGIVMSILILPKVFPYVFEEEYSAAIPAFNWLLISLLFLYNSVLRTGHFTITGNTKVLMYTQIAGALINILANFIMIPLVGINGAAIATAITTFLSVFLLNIFSKDGRELFLWQLQAFNPMYIFK